MDQEVENQGLTSTLPQSPKPKSFKVPLLVGLALLVLILIGFVYQKYQTPNLPPSPQASKATPAFEAQVAITKDGFVPESILVKKGTQIIWQNQDENPHQVSSDPHPTHTNLAGFDSLKPLASGDSFSFIFEKSGTFTYHDHLNPLKLQGTVIVE